MISKLLYSEVILNAQMYRSYESDVIDFFQVSADSARSTAGIIEAVRSPLRPPEVMPTKLQTRLRTGSCRYYYIKQYYKKQC